MNQVTTDVLIMMFSYTVVFFLTIFVLNFLTNGFLFKYLVVKASRGKKILITLWHSTGVNYISGKVDEGALLFKYNKKDRRIENCDRFCIRRIMGVNNIEVDEITNTILNHSKLTFQNGHDAIKTDAMINRALLMPQLKDNKVIIILFLCVIIFIGVLGCIFMNYQNQETIKNTYDIIQSINKTALIPTI